MTEGDNADDTIPRFPLGRRERLQLKRPEKRLLTLKFDHIPVEVFVMCYWKNNFVKDQVVVMFPGYGTQYLTMGSNVCCYRFLNNSEKILKNLQILRNIILNSF